MKYWVYYKEQCEYCKNRKGCQYIEKVQKYLKDIDNLDDRGIYGTTSFWCDYYNLDEELYWQKNQGECASNAKI